MKNCHIFRLVLISLNILFPSVIATTHDNLFSVQSTLMPDFACNDTVPLATRAYWMRRAIQALSDLESPCPFAAFGTAIVNHTDSDGLGELICIGVNGIQSNGDPTLHGEIAAIQNCSKVLTDPDGPYKLSPSAAISAFSQLSLYTTAESCPMCASAIRWTGFREYIYATTIETLVEYGWSQILIASPEVFARSRLLSTRTKLIEKVLANETDPLFSWQFNKSESCPSGCQRSDTTCEPVV